MDHTEVGFLGREGDEGGELRVVPLSLRRGKERLTSRGSLWELWRMDARRILASWRSRID